MEAAKEAGADIVVLCSSDDEYPAMAAEFAALAGNTASSTDGTASPEGKNLIPVIAGYPKEHHQALQKAGIEHFIHVRSNVLEELKNYQKRLDI
jgi:methylmalonyl-CoA mutase